MRFDVAYAPGFDPQRFYDSIEDHFIIEYGPVLHPSEPSSSLGSHDPLELVLTRRKA